MIVLIALAVSAFWTAVGCAVGMRGLVLFAVWALTFAASFFYLAFNQGANQ